MATPDDIIEARRIANARRMAEAATTPVNKNALADLQASIAASKQVSATATENIKAAQADKDAAVAAQIQAARDAAAIASATGGTVDPKTGLITPPTTVKVSTNVTKKEVRREMIGSGISRILRVYYDDNTFEDFPAGETPGSQPLNVQTTDPTILAFIKQLQEQNAALLAQQNQAKIDAAAAAEAAKKEKAENAISVLTARFAQYGLQSLVPKIRELAIGGATEATITLQLMESPEYKLRFKANQDRIKKGLAVLDPGDYIGIEDKYRQILRAYGLSQFDNDNYVSQFIANDVSAAELSSRVQTAVQRVQNADPAVLGTLTKYYGIGANDLVGYVLDPEQQFQKIERQVAAAEIGAAAGLQGIQPGVAVAEQLAAQGVSKAEAQKGYATIADILPGAEKLSQIYGTTLEGYGLAEAEQEVFNTLASAQRKRRKLVEREVASFSGASGLSKASLTQQVGGTF